MFSHDIRFEGFDARDWQRFVSLFKPEPPSDASRASRASSSQGTIMAIHDGERLRKLIHSQAGRLRLDDVSPDWPLSAAELAARHNARIAVTIRLGCLDTMMEDLGAYARRSDDATAQWLTLATLFRQQVERGSVDIWPKQLGDIPVPTRNMVERGIDMVCPRGKTMLLGLFDRGQLWTSIALRRGHDGFDLVLGPEAIRSDVGLLSGDMRRDHRHLITAVRERCGPLSLGCFAEQRTFRKLEVEPQPGAWAMAVAVRDVVLHPVPPAMAIPLGLDVGWAAFDALRLVAQRFDASGVVSPTLRALKDVARASQQDAEQPIFNPLDLLRRFMIPTDDHDGH